MRTIYAADRTSISNKIDCYNKRDAILSNSQTHGLVGLLLIRVCVFSSVRGLIRTDSLGGRIAQTYDWSQCSFRPSARLEAKLPWPVQLTIDVRQLATVCLPTIPMTTLSFRHQHWPAEASNEWAETDMLLGSTRCNSSSVALIWLGA